jgi:antitoxin ParD1/3/4
MPRSFVLGEHFERLIDEQVRSGLYVDGNEVVRDALRMLEEQQIIDGYPIAELRAMIAEGEASGVSDEDGFVFLNRLRAKCRSFALFMPPDREISP